MMHRQIHILCRAWRLYCVSPLLLSCLRASWLRLATSQAANSLRTIAFRGIVYKSDEISVFYNEKKYYFGQKSWIYYILKDSYMFASYKKQTSGSVL